MKGTMLFEIGGIADNLCIEALHQAGFKLPINTKVVKRSKALSEAEKLKMEAQHESSLDAIKAEDALQKDHDFRYRQRDAGRGCSPC
jgi:hypothetical protein